MAAAIRTLRRLVNHLVGYAVAFITVVMSDKRQRLGDMAALTLVVRGQVVKVLRHCRSRVRGAVMETTQHQQAHVGTGDADGTCAAPRDCGQPIAGRLTTERVWHQLSGGASGGSWRAKKLPVSADR
jgi:hypothetical protein